MGQMTHAIDWVTSSSTDGHDRFSPMAVLSAAATR